MRYCLLLSSLAAALIAFAIGQKVALALALAWLGGDFFALGIAHGLKYHDVFGKRSDGSMSLSRQILFLPLLAYTGAVWHLARILSREPVTGQVTADLIVGRRLLPAEVPQSENNGHGLASPFENYVDLTAEFPEHRPIRQSAGYVCFPILDGAAPSPEALLAAVQNLRPGRTFIHCAQGHGRTGLFALALLMARGTASSVDDGLRLLQSVRPAIRLNRLQADCIRRYCELLVRMGTHPPDGRN